MIGFFAAAFWVEIGCLLGACDSGMATNWFLSVDQAGVIGKRLPVQLFEALVFLWIFWVFWKRVLKFHVQGKFLSSGLMMLGLVKLIASLFKEPAQNLNINSVSIRLDLLFPAAVFLLGLYFHYKIYKKTPVTDLASTGKFLVNPKSQRSMISKFMRWCYNQKANFWVSLERSMKKILKLLNVRSNPEHFRNK